MLEDQVALLLQNYLGNYVKGLNKEALKISVWRGDVELKNMQLKPEALNALKLPVKVKAGFLGSVKLKVPWSRLGQDPVLVYLDHICVLVEPSTQVEGSSADAVQEAKKQRIREMEMKLLESTHQLKSEMNKSWLGSLINTIIGNLKLSITNIHIRYEDLESNPGHPFSAGVALAKLAAMTVDDSGKETFVTGGALERIQKSVELERLALYLDSDIFPWDVGKPWEDLLPSEWSQVFEFGSNEKNQAAYIEKQKHCYILKPVTGNARYSKRRPDECSSKSQPLQKAAVKLDDVTLSLSKDGYRDILKLADNFAAFNKRLRYAHYRPLVPVKSCPKSWWEYAYRAVSDELKKASGKLSWEQVLKYGSLRKKYITLYASFLKSDPSRMAVDDNPEIEELDRGLDIEVILQWRMLAHKFVEKSMESDPHMKEQKPKKSWWSFGWTGEPVKDESESFSFTDEDWEQLNKIIGYKEGDDKSLINNEKEDVLHSLLEVQIERNASRLVAKDQECLAELSCEGLDCSVKLYSEAKVFDLKLGSYRLSSPSGLLAQSAATYDSLVGIFYYKPFDAKVDWSMVAKASPCYMTYLRDSIEQITKFFDIGSAVSQTMALETAAAVQMTINDVKRTAQQQVNRALKDHSRFLLDLDIAAPKIMIPTSFCPENARATKLLLDLGNLMLRTEDKCETGSPAEMDMYLQFNLVLSDVSAFLVDGDFCWDQAPLNISDSDAKTNGINFMPVVDRCGIVLKLQQIRTEHPSYPSTRLAVRLPSLGFHFSPARYHRLMQVAKIFKSEDDNSNSLHPWNQSDFEGWLFLLVRKGVGNREAVWQRRYICLVGPFLYVLESPDARTYKQSLSLRGKQIYHIPPELAGNIEHVLAVCDAGRSNVKVMEDANAFIIRCDSDDSRKNWQSRLQGAIYRASGTARITSLSESSEEPGTEFVGNKSNVMDVLKESIFITGVLDELKICFSYPHQGNHGFTRVLLGEERRLFEFRAIGGQVELSIRANDMFIGTMLKSLEIEDLVCRDGMSKPCYLVRSFIKSADSQMLSEPSTSDDIGKRYSEGEEKFFEASENLVDFFESSSKSSQNISGYPTSRSLLSSEKLSIRPPSFNHIAGLLPDEEVHARSVDMEHTDALDSFVKAQIVIYDQNSSLYKNVDKQVSVTLATLSFFCHRPTILAIVEFVNAINVEDDICEAFTDESPSSMIQHDSSREDLVDGQHSSTAQESVIKGLLGKGKSRVILYVTLNMARAQISLMNENGTKLATLSQDNLLTDIKVFPSSFSIKAALGNLKISDDSLLSSHRYYWACDMRNPGGSSFVELFFSSFSVDDEDYNGYDYSLLGQLSEVRIIYLNRFIQEVSSYFMGLVPKNQRGFVKLKDQVTNSEKWFTVSAVEGSPAVKLDLSLRKPIILMPRRTDSLDYLELDVVHITIQNTFQWFCGDKSELGAVHLEILTVGVEDINLTVGTGVELCESIIKDVKGLSVIIRRSLRDLLHKIPTMDAAIKIDELKAALSNREYRIIMECAVSNISETPNHVPPMPERPMSSSGDVSEPPFQQTSGSVDFEPHVGEPWINMKASVAINLVELCLHSGISRDAPLATVQVRGAWLLYKSNTMGEGFLSATLKGFTVIDDREGTEQEFRLAIGKNKSVGYSPLRADDGKQKTDDQNISLLGENDVDPVHTMLILDANFGRVSNSVSLCVQRPQLLVALDFLLAVVEFFVPSVSGMLSNEEDENPLNIVDAIILDQATYIQPSSEFSLSPKRPLVADDERFNHFTYDGNGGRFYLLDRQGNNLSHMSTEALIYVGSGKKLQFKNVIIKNGQYLDSCIMLGTNSSYSVSEGDNVFIERGNEGPLLNVSEERSNSEPADNIGASISTEFIIELQAIGPELTFYNTSKDVGESLVLSNKVLHAQLDAFCRLVLKGETIEMSANALGLSVESNGVRILEPFDATVKYSSTSGKTNIHLVVSDIFMNFSFSILRLFLAVEEDILSFLRRTSRKVTVLCSQFDKVGTIHSPYCEQTYVFWRPRAPPGFAILGDCLTPVNKPPTKGVIAVNISHVRVRRPVSFQLICPSSVAGDISRSEAVSRYIPLLASDDDHQDSTCSIWFPVPPQGYVALGCVVSTGRTEPPLSSAFCILSSLVSPCALRDCIIVNSKERYPVDLAFWRVDNSVGSFLLADPTTKALTGKAYDLRHIIFGFLEGSYRSPKNEGFQDVHSGHDHSLQSERSVSVNSGWHSEAIASFRLIWWNQGSSSRKKLSIWRPVVPQGMVYLGDIAVQGYEPPNMSIVLHDTGDDDLLKHPVDFQLVGKIDKRRGIENISFWLPHAPPGFVSLGCIACKGTLKQDEFSSLRCIRSDMVTGDQFQDESLWDTSDANLSSEPFSIWRVGNEVGTFIVRSGFRKPPKRVALKLADPNISSDLDNTVIDAEIRTFSAALFDDYGGLMVPLFNISLSGIGFSLHGRPGCLNSNVSFSLAARSYNDKYEAWEPLVEPVDGFLRYQYDTNAPGAASQLRLTSTKDLNLNISASNANMFFQAYASWNNLSHIHEYYEKTEAKVPAYDGKSILDIHQRRNYYIIPQNKLVQDIYLRATEIRGLQKIIRMPSGDMKPLKVPVSKNMLSSHLEGKLGQKHRTMVAIIIGDAQLPCVEELSTQQYSVSIRLLPSDSIPNGSLLTQQSARTCGRSSDCSLPSGFQLVNWGEVFFFKVDSLDFYVVELMVTEMGKGEPVGFFSSPLNRIARTIQDGSNSHDYGLSLIELSFVESMKTHQGDTCNQTHGRLRCSVLLCPLSEDYSSNNNIRDERRRGPIEISPTKEGPWTTVRLNYAARAACWRLGNDVVASEVSVKDGNRYVTIRSLVSVRNDTDFMLDICLKPKALSEGMISIKDGSKHSQKDVNDDLVGTDEYFETEKYNPVKGWVCCSNLANQDHSRQIGSPPEISGVELPSGWEWVDDWHVDNVSVNAADGWVYAPDHERLNWPESYNHSNFVNYARQRRWIRNRNQISGILQQQISVGQLKPGDTVPLPLSGLIHSGMYVLKLRPWNVNDTNEYSWSSVVDKDSQSFSGEPEEISEIFVSALTESEELLCCTHETGNSSNSAQSLWFCLSIKATEIAKDMLSNPIQDWSLVVKSPLSVINFLPFSAEFSVLLMQANNQFVPCCQGIFFPGKTAQVYNADVRKPLYFSLRPQGGWLPIHEAVLISHPSGVTSKTISLRSSFSGRIVQVILEQNHDKERELVAKVVRVYAPFWITIARCPPLTWRLLDIGAKMQRRMFSPPFHLKQNSEEVIEEITKEEIFEGFTIDSALKFKLMGLSVSISQSGEKKFGPVKDLSPLGDMDGSVDLYAYNDDGSCMRLFISSKPCPYQSVPTKVISVRPFMTFTNRLGQDIFVKLSNEDEPKVLHSYDSRVSFTSREAGGQEKIQVRLESTKWCFPFEITKEDTISLILREHNGDRKFLRTEIRGYEEGSRFIVVFRLGSIDGPIRVENRTMTKKISIRQSGLGDDAWIHLSPLSTTNFSWEDPYGQRTIDTEIHHGSITSIPKFNMEKGGLCSANEGVPGLHFHVIEIGDIKVATFFDDSTSDSNSHEKCEVLASIDNWSTSHVQNHAAPLELIIELGVFGVSVIDHRPREISFLYLESVFFSYSTGYDGGTTNRFKLIFGHLQLDNQLPLTVMPVVLAPEQTTGIHHPVFKMTITMRNENLDGTLVYPYVYIRVTENCWRLRIHEPIIWALVDLYNNLQIDRIPKSSTITQVDPEIRVDLIDISEIRLKLHLETDPTQRPHGVLGIWSPILSAVGNAFKIQVHLRKVMHRNRYMRKSSVVPAIVNRIWRDLIHNPLHLLFSVDVLGMTSSTLASLSKGFADLSTDGQFLQLRSKQMWSRRITGVSDGFLQGTEALAQGVAFGVSGVLTKPVESTRQHGLLGLAHGLGRAFLGFIVQPMSGALDFFSLTVDGIGASCSRCLEVFSSKATFQRIRNPRAIHVDGIIREYCEREAVGQMVLYLAEASRHFGCTDIFREPSKFAWSDYYEDHFVAPHQRIALITNKRVMLLQCLDLEKMDKKPSKIMWDVPWEELMALELAKAGYSQPSLVILHLKNFKRSENFIQLIKCNVEGDTEGEPQAVRICSVIRRVWKAHQSDMRSLVLKVPSSQRHVYFGSDEADGRNLQNQIKPIIKPGEFSSFSCVSGERKFLEHTINFQKIWSSERELKSRCTLCQEQGLEGSGISSIWRPVCPYGYVSIGDIARVGNHPPNVAAVYHTRDGRFALPVGYDLVWRNCSDDYKTRASIWLPRAPEGFVSLGCVAVAGFAEPQPNSVYCVVESLAEETSFEEQEVWSALDSYPWACHFYQVRSDALHFVALRQPKEKSDFKPMRVIHEHQQPEPAES